MTLVAGAARVECINCRDQVSGGGREIFVFTAKSGKLVRVEDFQDGKDRIEIANGAERFRDVDLRQKGDDILLRFANTKALIEDADLDDFSATDFILA